ncbi:hypothetical protein [Aquimarina algiphila]|uniref:hypothetical protein n=1 Tax=Aquimarina algiphila TaxID=2047982 RepID=UPI00232EE61E|nr:hypothetical protein [Aquimarina algiphila]
MNEEEFNVTPSKIDRNVFFILRESGSEVKVIVTDSNENEKIYYAIRNQYLVSPVSLTDDEIQYFQTNLKTA